MIVLAATLSAQATPPWMLKALSPKARVIETAVLNTGTERTRALVLWMRDPERVIRQGEWDCPGSVYGDYWRGPAWLSLVDITEERVINTIEIHGYVEAGDTKIPSVAIPIRVSNDFYYVPRVEGAANEGKPKILNLRDLTGEGVAGQFALFDYEACGLVWTTALGYSPRTDAAVQYRVAVTHGGHTEVGWWAEQIFGMKPTRPGHWNRTWYPGHGADFQIHDEVTFDPIKQVFLDKRRDEPYTIWAVPQKVDKKQH